MYVRLNNDEYVDEIRTRVVPRYKTSYMSGDEWRYHVEVDLIRKGDVLTTASFSNLETVADYLPYWWRVWRELMTDEEFDRGFETDRRHEQLCHQYGCSKPATTVYQLKNRFPCRYGHRTEPYTTMLRAFCDEHRTRGDCGLDDADDNYVPYHEKSMFSGYVVPTHHEYEKSSAWACPSSADVEMVVSAVSAGVVTTSDLAGLGLSPWNRSGEPIRKGCSIDGSLWLIPKSWYDVVPNGTDFVTILGTRETFMRGLSDSDSRFGYLPYGFVIKS